MDKVKIVFRIETKQGLSYCAEMSFKGCHAYDSLSFIRDLLDKEGIRYLVYKKKFLGWKLMYTVNFLSKISERIK